MATSQTLEKSHQDKARKERLQSHGRSYSANLCYLLNKGSMAWADMRVVRYVSARLHALDLKPELPLAH